MSRRGIDLLLTFNRAKEYFSVERQQELVVGENKSDILQGTLDLMVLKTLESMGPLHGYGIARRIEQVSDDTLSLNQGTIYPALLRLQQRGGSRRSGAHRRATAAPSFIR